MTSIPLEESEDTALMEAGLRGKGRSAKEAGPCCAGLSKRTVYAIGGVGMVVIAATIVAAVLLASAADTDTLGTLFTLEDYLNRTVRTEAFVYEWFPNQNAYTQWDATLGIVSIDAKSHAQEVIVPPSELVNASTYRVSPNGDFVVLATEYQPLYRHSFFARYFVYDISAGTQVPLTTTSDDLVRYAAFAPVGTNVAFVRNNNIFVTDVDTSNEIQVTFDGVNNAIINGLPDWVYEEEIFSTDHTLWWSPDGASIAFLRFDETLVPEYEFAVYETDYPGEYRYKYPLPGYDNSNVTMAVYNVADNTTLWLDVDVYGTPSQYVTRVVWVDNSTVACKVLNRLQNSQTLLTFDVTTGARTVVNVQTDTKWIEQHDSLTFIPGTTQFLDLRPNGDWMHIAVFDMANDPSTPRWLTSGDWEVTEICGLYPDGPIVFFVSTEVSALERHVYRIALTESPGSQVKLTTGEGYYSASFADTGEYYVLSYGGPGIPETWLVSAVSSITYKVPVEINAAAKAANDRFDLPYKEFTTVPGAHNEDLRTYVMYPPGFDDSGLVQYPVLMYVYGGPGSQTVSKKWQLDWHSAMASRGFIIASVDNTGTGFSGESFMKATYLELGIKEVDDQIAAAEYFATLSYVDADRIGIWGWSYGGFMTASIMATGTSAFKMGMAVAPPTDWRWYDTVYTERYMRTPALNLAGYEKTAIPPHVANMTGDFLMVHGLADDNVHFQNSAMLVAALVEANIPFQAMYYPNQNHNINRDGSHQHIYELLTAFLEEHLGPGAGSTAKNFPVV